MNKYQIKYKKSNKSYEFDFLANNDVEAKEKFKMWKNQNKRWFSDIILNSYITITVIIF